MTATLALGLLGAAGGTTLCLNASNEIASCSSSLRYKTEVRPFSAGLDLLSRLRPIAFTWKQGVQRDLGLAAEEVEQVEPLLVTYNAAGQVEGVKYDRLNVVLVNAMQQQQRAIDRSGTRMPNSKRGSRLWSRWSNKSQINRRDSEGEPVAFIRIPTGRYPPRESTNLEAEQGDHAQ